MEEDETAELPRTEKQVLATVAPQQRNPAVSRAPGHIRGDDGNDDVAMADVNPYVDPDLASLHLAAREMVGNPNKALLHSILLAHTRPTKLSDAAVAITLGLDRYQNTPTPNTEANGLPFRTPATSLT